MLSWCPVRTLSQIVSHVSKSMYRTAFKMSQFRVALEANLDHAEIFVMQTLKSK